MSNQDMKEILDQILADTTYRITLPYYAATNYPKLLIIQPRPKRPVFTAPPTLDVPAVYKYLCNTILQNGEELSKHVSLQH